MFRERTLPIGQFWRERILSLWPIFRDSLEKLVNVTVIAWGVNCRSLVTVTPETSRKVCFFSTHFNIRPVDHQNRDLIKNVIRRFTRVISRVKNAMTYFFQTSNCSTSITAPLPNFAGAFVSNQNIPNSRTARKRFSGRLPASFSLLRHLKLIAFASHVFALLL